MAEDPLSVHARARVGRVLRGKWTLDRMIGVGGMAAVYEATHRNGSKVAIKMLHPTLMFDTGFAHRLVQEGYVANKINHAAAVKIYDDDTDDVDGAVFLVMELLEGSPLSSVRRQRKRFGEAETLKMMMPVLECLGSAHQKGIVHRDIKPENLFVTRDGAVRVLDFGIARVSDGSSVSQTRTGMVVGSPAYMSPEQALGKMNSVGPQTDVYAVGATMFAMLSGTTPHAGESTQEMIVLVATQSARSLKSVLPEASDVVAKIIDRALSYEREARFPDAMAMLHEMRNALAILEGGAPAKVLPTFASDEDDEGETKVAQPAVGRSPAGAAEGAPSLAKAGPMGQRQPTPAEGTGLAGKLRAPTMAPTGSPGLAGLAPAPAPAPALPQTQAMEAFPMPAGPGVGSGAFNAVRPTVPESFGQNPEPGRAPLGGPQSTMAMDLGTLGPLGPVGAPEANVANAGRPGVNTNFAWANAAGAPGAETPAKPARPRWLLPAMVAAVSVLGLGVALVLTGGGTTQPPPAAPVVAARPAVPAPPAVPPPAPPAVPPTEPAAPAIVDAGAPPAPLATVDAAVAPVVAAAPTPAETPAPPPAETRAPQANARERRREPTPPAAPAAPAEPRRRQRSRERPASNNALGY